MRRNSSRFSVLLLLLAPVLAVALTLALAGAASAAPRHLAKATLPVGSSCLSPAPSVQKVEVDQLASVDVTVECNPIAPASFQYLYVTWGDSATSTYPVCVEVCHVPPFVISTSHIYKVVGDYHPLFCPTLTASTASCPSVEVIVLPPV